MLMPRDGIDRLEEFLEIRIDIMRMDTCLTNDNVDIPSRSSYRFILAHAEKVSCVEAMPRRPKKMIGDTNDRR